MANFTEKVRSFDSVRVASGKNDQDAVDQIKITGTANAANANVVTITNASHGQATTYTIQDAGTAANIITSQGAQTIAGAVTLSSASGLVVSGASGVNVSGGGVITGASGTAGSVKIYPATASKGDLKITCSNQTGNTEVVVNAAAMGQATTLTVRDPGGASATFVDTAGGQSIAGTTTLATGTVTTANVTDLLYGATPVHQVDPASCTITAAAGAANHSTITVQLKDGAGNNLSRVHPFKVYLATSNTGLTLQSAASTGYSVSSGGVKDVTGSTTVTQGIAAFSSATGGCVLDLLDTGKQTGNLILMLHNGFVASAAITAGSYG